MRQVRLYYTSDIHGHLFPTDYMSRDDGPGENDLGLFAVAAQFGAGPDDLILDNGDTLQGSPLASYAHEVQHSPAVIAKALGQLGYTAVTAGNHDFSFGWPYLASYIKELDAQKVRFTCQNITDEKGRVLYPWLALTLGNGVRVGLVGILTDWVNRWEPPANLAGVRVTDPYAALQHALREMHGQADLRVCLYHGGFETDGTDENLANRICETLDLDVLLTGHQHRHVDGHTINGTYVVQPRARGAEAVRLDLTETPDGWHIASAHLQARAGDVRSPRTAAAADAARPTGTQVEAWLDEPVGTLSRPLPMTGRVSGAIFGSPIADLINQVQLAASGAQVSATSLANEVGGLHRHVTRRDVLTSYPYENNLVVVSVTGAILRAALERAAEYLEVDATGQPAIALDFITPSVRHYAADFFAGLDYGVDVSRPRGHRVMWLKLWRDDDEPTHEIGADEPITVCLTSYRASGADGYGMYEGATPVAEIPGSVADLILAYVSETPVVDVARRRPVRLAWGFGMGRRPDASG